MLLRAELAVEVVLHVLIDLDDAGLFEGADGGEGTELHGRAVEVGVGRKLDVVADEFHVDLDGHLLTPLRRCGSLL